MYTKVEMTATADDPHALLAHYEQAMLTLDADALAGLYATDGTHEFGFLVPGLEPVYRGREAIRATYRLMWSSPSVHLVEIRHRAVHDTADPEVVIAEWTAEGRRADGEHVALSGVLVLRARDGQLVHVRDYMDGFGLAHRTGR